MKKIFLIYNHSYVFSDGEFNGDIFKVISIDLDLEMTLKSVAIFANLIILGW